MSAFADLLALLWRATAATGSGERAADGAAGGQGPDGEAAEGAGSATGPRVVLPSAFDVTGLATGAIAAGLRAAAELVAARAGAATPAVTVDSRDACADFAREGLFTPVDWEHPAIWDPIAGNYRTADGWIRLHTNYTWHRAVVERVLDARGRDAVHAALATRTGDEVETAVVAAGGAAAVMHDRAQWLASAAGAATAGARPISITERPAASSAAPRWNGRSGAGLPLAGVRVLDLTRVIAGPTCTTFLGGYGADVLRIDPPGFDEVTSLLPVTTVGKRTAFLDLRESAGRAAFERLVADADVLVTGLRSDALAGLGYDDAALGALNADLIHASLDAYGWEGPWRGRRGFDSLVQMSCGIAAAGAAAAGVDTPTPLPVQALDHAAGWLLGAAIARALTRRLTDGTTARIHASLIGTANLLYELTAPAQAPAGLAEVGLEEVDTAWGPARGVPMPGRIDGVVPDWAPQAGPLGRHPARWNPR
ncbi:CoA transferase [Microbacterium kribbense]|uniref:CoA transferase n=1 Tax=Microbacterium kribbense TaxID=433645 RepID=A0ABP7GHM4_9MICO